MKRCLTLLALAMIVSVVPLRAQQQGGSVLERAGLSRVKGPQTAKVMVLEIGDFQCPFCARFSTEVYPRLDSAYIRTGKVQWAFVNMPLPNHGHAWIASEAAMCTGATGGSFWAMHDQLFRAQAEWSGAASPAGSFRRWAQQAGATMEAYDACVAGDQVAPQILQDLMYAQSLQVTGTPAFLINNEQTVVGLKSFEEWKALLDAALEKAGK